MPICLVTGGSRGIGRATALLAAQRGFDVAVNYAKDQDAAYEVAMKIKALGRRAITVQADVSHERSVLAMFERIDTELGPLTALVNNAGVIARKAKLNEMSVERWQRLFNVNVIGSMLCAREAARRMSTQRQRAGGSMGAGGAIVNVSSAAARLGSPAQYVDYAASKGAIDTFTVGLAKELAAEGIRVNGVRPGIIDTEIHDSCGETGRAAAAAPTVPMQRVGTAQEVAQAIVWLLLPEASYVTGAIVDVAGGR